MNSRLHEILSFREAEISFAGRQGVIAGTDENDVLKVRLQTAPGEALPGLYDRRTGLIDTGEKRFSFTGEVAERYMQDNACMLNIRALSGFYEVAAYPQEQFAGEREAIVISASSEKFVVNILEMDPNHAVVRGSSSISDQQKVWLRYRELAVAGLTQLVQETEKQSVYCLDFSVESLEKRGKIAEMILKENSEEKGK